MQKLVGPMEQRKHYRFPFDRSVEYTPAWGRAAGVWRAGQAIDFSFGGVRILGERRLHQDDLVQIRLEPSENGSSFVTHARVVYVHLQANGHWLLGCEFLPSTAQAVSPSGIELMDHADQYAL